MWWFSFVQARMEEEAEFKDRIWNKLKRYQSWWWNVMNFSWTSHELLMNHEAKWSEMKRHEATCDRTRKWLWKGSSEHSRRSLDQLQLSTQRFVQHFVSHFISFYHCISLYKSHQSTLLYFVTLCGTPKWHFQWLSEAALDKQFQEEEAATEEREKKKAFYALESWDPQEHSIALQNMK